MINGMPFLLESLFNVKSLEEVSVESLREVVTEFPSFNAGHFLLSKKLQLENDPAFAEEALKTALYFNNPIWLQWLLAPNKNDEEKEDASFHTQAAVSTEEITISNPVDVETASDDADLENEEISEAMEEVFDTLPDNTPVWEPSTVLNPSDEEITGSIAADEEVSEIMDGASVQTGLAHEEAVQQEVAEEAPVYVPVDTAILEEIPVVVSTPEYVTELKEPAWPVNEEPLKMQPVVHFDAKKAESIVFEPYHVIDYFASQGIKLVIEDHPTDTFGKQLKSFTDWLKVMKRIPQKPLTDEQEDQESDRIRHFAAHSIEEKDVLTETMAEVLAKQGMYENAVALYRKLSLLYPSKSAYFAARIEQLKPFLS